MDSFISTIVFLLPGFLMYFWIQSFGFNPVIKHSSTEMGAVSALLWLPVSLATIVTYNLIGGIYGSEPIWSLEALKKETGNLSFLAWFSFISIPISFLLSVMYIKLLLPLQRVSINYVRNQIGMASLAETSTVWEKFFIKVNKQQNDGELPVKIYKLDKPEETCLVGMISIASRPFETERALVLNRMAELKASDDCYRYEEVQAYVDLKSGYVVSVLNLDKPQNNSN